MWTEDAVWLLVEPLAWWTKHAANIYSVHMSFQRSIISQQGASITDSCYDAYRLQTISPASWKKVCCVYTLLLFSLFLYFQYKLPFIFVLSFLIKWYVTCVSWYIITYGRILPHCYCLSLFYCYICISRRLLCSWMWHHVW